MIIFIGLVESCDTSGNEPSTFCVIFLKSHRQPCLHNSTLKYDQLAYSPPPAPFFSTPWYPWKRSSMPISIPSTHEEDHQANIPHGYQLSSSGVMLICLMGTFGKDFMASRGHQTVTLNRLFCMIQFILSKNTNFSWEPGVRSEPEIQ